MGVQEVQRLAENTLGSQDIRLQVGDEDKESRSQMNQQSLQAGFGLCKSRPRPQCWAGQWELRLVGQGQRVGMSKDDRNIQELAP